MTPKQAVLLDNFMAGAIPPEVVEAYRALIADKEAMWQVVSRARAERATYDALPMIASGEPHEAWVRAHRALHVAVSTYDWKPRS